MPPVISMLVPSRNRSHLIDETLHSFLDMADDPSRIEIMVRLHASDADSLRWAVETKLPVRVVIGDDADGYRSISNFVNCLAAMARGSWFGLWSDENRIQTKGWDTLVSAHDARECHILYARVLNNSGQIIPFISRRLYEVLGHAGQTAHCDCYLNSLGQLADVVDYLPIETKMGPNARVAERDIWATWREYRGEECARLFDIDKIKLGAYLGRALGSWSTRDAAENPW